MEAEEILLWKKKKWEKRYKREDFGGRFNKYIGKKHLDFGCGFGTFAFIVAKKNAEKSKSFSGTTESGPKKEVYGFDIDEKLIKLGKRDYKLKNLHLSSKKVKGKFDSISLFFVVHHLRDINKYLKEFYKHLNQKGKIMVYAFRKVSKTKYKKWYERKKEIGEYKESFEKSYKEHCRFSVKEFTSIAEKIGFKTINSEEAGDYWFVYIGSKCSALLNT